MSRLAHAQAADALIPAARICAEFGVCRRTLARWVADEGLGFPAPLIINARWYFQRGAVEAWKVTRARLSAR